MTDNELLLAISHMMDKKPESMEVDFNIIKKVIQEHSEKLQKIS